MTELLDRIDAILTDTIAEHEADSDTKIAKGHPLTSWTSDRIFDALAEELPLARGDREKECLDALRSQKYGRCKIYLRLVEGNAYIEAVNAIARIPNAFAAAEPSKLSETFYQCVRTIDKANKQAISEMEGDDWTIQKASSVVTRLEKLAIEIFAKGLGDDGEA